LTRRPPPFARAVKTFSRPLFPLCARFGCSSRFSCVFFFLTEVLHEGDPLGHVFAHYSPRTTLLLSIPIRRWLRFPSYSLPRTFLVAVAAAGACISWLSVPDTTALFSSNLSRGRLSFLFLTVGDYVRLRSIRPCFSPFRVALSKFFD